MVLPIAAVVSLTMLLSMTPCWAKATVTDDFRKFEKSTLVTPADFIQAAKECGCDIHEVYFDLRPYEGTGTCLMCHEEDGAQMLDSGHFKWRGTVKNIVGLEGEQVGKQDLINNLCIATPSNEGRCTQCHTGYGWADASYDFSNPENIDCLSCHDQTGTYKKGPKSAGMPDPGVDLQAVAASIRVGSEPTRKACLTCHANAGGGDNVKHGDLSSDLVATTREYDVHMGADGANMTCIACHGTNHDPKTGDVNHGIAGMPLHSVYEGEMKQCVDCHGSAATIHAGTNAEAWLVDETWHDNLACQVCHIPAVARKIATMTEWYWEDAGDLDRQPVTDPETGRVDYNKMKGSFVWQLNYRPVLRYFNGKWTRKVIGVTDTYTEEPIDMASPVGDYSDHKAMIYPFKVMTGNQVVDPNNKIVLVPHLFGTAGGPNAYWGNWDWDAAIQDAAAITGQNYSGTYKWGDTTMLYTVNHEIAPAENALGAGIMPDNCMDCHQSGYIDWVALGWTADPLDGGVRNTTVVPAKSGAGLLSAKDTPMLR
jgi:octaheme c-type cytochrome (tetrathionate reductase family)